MADWTEGRKKSFITSVLRGGSRRWPPRNAVLNASKTVKKINPKSGRMAQHYQCAECKKEFPAKEVAVDHKEPVVDPATGFVSWDVFISRLYCEEDGMQTLCHTCHDRKSAEERIERKRKNED
jgi:hypothetical protein